MPNTKASNPTKVETPVKTTDNEAKPVSSNEAQEKKIEASKTTPKETTPEIEKKDQ